MTVSGDRLWQHWATKGAVLPQLDRYRERGSCHCERQRTHARVRRRAGPTLRRSKASITIDSKAEILDRAVNHHFDQLRARPVEG